MDDHNMSEHLGLQLAEQILHDRPVAYHPMIAKITGSVTAAIFLSQILYWTGKGARSDGYIWKTRKDMEEETGLSRREQETARRKLRELGILLEKRCGIPAKMHYRVDFDRFADVAAEYHQWQCRLAENANLHCTKPPNYNGEKRQTITESTIENISENTKSDERKDFRRAARDIYYDVFGFYPSSEQCSVIREHVHDPVLWRKIITGWAVRGYDPKNVLRMVALYEKGYIPERPPADDPSDFQC